MYEAPLGFDEYVWWDCLGEHVLFITIACAQQGEVNGRA